jgi:hypothetical protein
MKFESRDSMTASGEGYTTVIARAPVTCGIGGSGAAATGAAGDAVGAVALGRAGAGATDGWGPPEHAATAMPTPLAIALLAHHSNIARKLTASLTEG